MRRLFFAGALAALAGCWTTAERGRAMESRITRLEEENQITVRQLEEQRQLLGERIAKADAQIAEAQKRLGELNAATRSTGAGVYALQERQEEELRKLRDEVATLREQLRATQTDTDEKIARARGQAAYEQFQARRKIEQMKDKPSDPQGWVARAREQEQTDRPVAREIYLDVTRNWPSDPAAAEAHYRLGELFVAEGKHREASLEFGKVAESYPRSPLAPDATEKAGEAILAMGMRDDAIGVFREVVQKYPGTGAAKAAAARLDELAPKKKAAPPPKKKR